LTLTLYCALVVLASLLGGALPSRLKLTHTRLQTAVSFVAGLMLGVALLHMIPHAEHFTHDLDVTVRWAVLGLLLMFFLIRAFHFHEHEPHEHAPLSRAHPHPWIGVAVGLSIHSAVDGVAMASSTLAEVHAHEGHGHAGPLLPGLGTFLAVLLHKPLDALAITSLMAASGWPQRTRRIVNVAFALVCPLGAALFVVGARSDPVVGAALALSAGAFLCISLGDLLPELQFHRHDRLKLSAALLLGVGLAYGVTFLEHGMHGVE
jgi:zinc and cadmium transporter